MIDLNPKRIAVRVLIVAAAVGFVWSCNRIDREQRAWAECQKSQESYLANLAECSRLAHTFSIQ
jgi:hypothetical protein